MPADERKLARTIGTIIAGVVVLILVAAPLIIISIKIERMVNPHCECQE